MDGEGYSGIASGSKSPPAEFTLSRDGLLYGADNSEGLAAFAARNGNLSRVLSISDGSPMPEDYPVSLLVCDVAACGQPTCTVDGVAGAIAMLEDENTAMNFAVLDKLPCGAQTFAPLIEPFSEMPLICNGGQR